MQTTKIRTLFEIVSFSSGYANSGLNPASVALHASPNLHVVKRWVDFTTKFAIISQNIARQLENRAAFKKVMKKSMQLAIKYGAVGKKVACAGRLGGAEIARCEWYKEGSVPLHTLRSDIDYAIANAYTTYGVIGIKVWVYKGLMKDKK